MTQTPDLSKPSDQRGSGGFTEDPPLVPPLLKGLFVLILLLAVGGFSASRVIRERKKEYQSEAQNHVGSIGFALFEFEDQYGMFPNVSTIAKVREKTDTDMSLGSKTSNDFFRQLLAAKIAQSEMMFYAKISGTRKPDGVFTGARALERGECGFTYFMGATRETGPQRPLVATPMIAGTDRFDPKPFKGVAVVLKADTSVMSLAIDKNGHAILDGKNIMDPTHPVWGGRPPVIAWPE